MWFLGAYPLDPKPETLHPEPQQPDFSAKISGLWGVRFALTEDPNTCLGTLGVQLYPPK